MRCCAVALLILLSSLVVPPWARRVIAEPASETLVFAGCDANLPLMRLLAQAFVQKRPGIDISLVAVGSTNGVALAAAGAVQIGLVSRALRPSETGLGLAFRPFARTAVVLAADLAVPDTVLTASDLLGHYSGTKRQWASGLNLVLLTREEGDSSIASLRENLPGFAEAYATGASRGHWIVLYNESAMHEALLTVPFALGLSDLGTIAIERLPIRALSIDGVASTLENVSSGRYPFTKTLGLVWRPDALPEAARAFVEFVRTDEAMEILTSHGYLPVP